MNDEDTVMPGTEITLGQLEEELRRVKARRRVFRMLGWVIALLLVMCALLILTSGLFLPVLRIGGDAMTPTLQAGDMVLVHKGTDVSEGELAAFYYHNSILVKRVIGLGGRRIELDAAGNVLVDGMAIPEPYLEQKTLGPCNIALPFTVPGNSLFVMGDNRAVSVDSRNTALGCVSAEQLVGKVFFRIWPLSRFGPLS